MKRTVITHSAEETIALARELGLRLRRTDSLNDSPAFIDLLDSRPNVAMVFGSRVRLMGRTISRRASRHYVGRISATLTFKDGGDARRDEGHRGVGRERQGHLRGGVYSMSNRS